jgi:hypothetical protein
MTYKMITKVGYTTKSGITTITIHTQNDDGSAHKSDYPYVPRPQFFTALQSLCPYIFSNVLGIEPTFVTNNPTVVQNVNFKAKDDVTLVTVTLKADLVEGSEWVINTPQFCLETQNEKFANLLLNVRDEAERYLNGERSE